jgi:hypothetical protein
MTATSPTFTSRLGGYDGLILKEARPSDLPVHAPTKLVFRVNLKAAKAQGSPFGPASSSSPMR